MQKLFFFFLADFSFFCLNYVKPFLSRVNKCTVTQIIIITFNVKSFMERLFDTLMHCKVRQVYAIYLVLIKEMTQK